MRAILKNTLCIIIVALVIYLICLISQPKKTKPLYMKKYPTYVKGNAAANTDLNADIYTNANAQRSQQGPVVIDRLPLVEENPLILPANEIARMNYKDVHEKIYKDTDEKELYTHDPPLFNLNGPINLVPLDINDSSHRRVNFY